MASNVASISRPYSPSWFDRLEAQLGRSRMPAWAFYLLLAILPLPLVLVADWASGTQPVGVILPFHVFFAMLGGLTLWYTGVLDRVAGRALDQMAPKLAVAEPERETLRYQLTNMPARPALVIALLGALAVLLVMVEVVLVDPTGQLVSVFGFSYQPISFAAFLLLIGASYVTGFVFLYHSYRQLRLIWRIYRDDAVVDVVDLGPIYAFSRVTALTALGIQVQADLWIVLNPQAGGSIVPVGVVIGLTIVAAIIFIVPLWGIHGRIVSEKGRALARNAVTRSGLMAELHHGVAEGKLDRVTQIKDAALALEVEAKSLATIRTWPWEPETLRLLLTAVLLPTTLFVVQYVVRQILGS